MENKIKLLLTEEPNEFDEETLRFLNSKNFSVHYSAKDGEELLNTVRLVPNKTRWNKRYASH